MNKKSSNTPKDNLFLLKKRLESSEIDLVNWSPPCWGLVVYKPSDMERLFGLCEEIREKKQKVG